MYCHYVAYLSLCHYSWDNIASRNVIAIWTSLTFFYVVNMLILEPDEEHLYCCVCIYCFSYSMKKHKWKTPYTYDNIGNSVLMQDVSECWCRTGAGNLFYIRVINVMRILGPQCDDQRKSLHLVNAF